MSNPSGTDHDDDADTVGAPGYPAIDDSDPVTEVIDTAQWRYTAPGFDAKLTQIIDRLPDESAPTEIFSTAGRPRAVGPRAIAPRKPGRPRWLLPVLLAVGALAAAALIGFLLLQRANAAHTAQINAVRGTIETFDTAVRDGNLATLRSVTCGQTNQTYVAYDEKAWADTYARISEAKQYPVVASIDDVVVNGEHAEANVTSYMAYDPGTTSTRSFDLQFRDERWKICQSS